jgi:hypothetical protein
MFKYYKYIPTTDLEAKSWFEIDKTEVPPGTYKYPDAAYVRLYFGGSDDEIDPKDKQPCILGFDTLWEPLMGMTKKVIS